VNEPGFIVEEWRRSREFTVAVLGNGPDRIAAPIEIVLPGAGRPILDAQRKSHGIGETVRSVGTSPEASIVSRLALAACKALGIMDWCACGHPLRRIEQAIRHRCERLSGPTVRQHSSELLSDMSKSD
jgi:D-alanine-D-alanine ligase-like ATP-grasp enzyme